MKKIIFALLTLCLISCITGNKQSQNNSIYGTHTSFRIRTIDSLGAVIFDSTLGIGDTISIFRNYVFQKRFDPLGDTIAFYSIKISEDTAQIFPDSLMNRFGWKTYFDTTTNRFSDLGYNYWDLIWGIKINIRWTNSETAIWKLIDITRGGTDLEIYYRKISSNPIDLFNERP